MPRRMRWQDRRIGSCRRCCSPGDLLVFNDTRVLPARVPARKLSGGRIELFLERRCRGAGRWCSCATASRCGRGWRCTPRRPGAAARAARDSGKWNCRARQWNSSMRMAWCRCRPTSSGGAAGGSRALPEPDGARAGCGGGADREPALRCGAAGGAGGARHRAQLHDYLHVGAGTFPAAAQRVDRGARHAQRALRGQRCDRGGHRAHARAGRRVVAVGTTVARALESAAPAQGVLAAGQGETTLFIVPGYRFQVIDALLTNFHLPQSTLLMLVAAFAGRAARAGGLCARGARALPVFQLRRCDAGVPARRRRSAGAVG
jgi:S-adenosylmethionine:tRNA ribosyltransferase-isomerase